MRLVLLLLLLVAAPARGERLRFTLDGHAREVLVTIPEHLPDPAPLILVLHGVLESGPRMATTTRHRFDALAAEQGFVTAYPSALHRVWNVGEGPGAARLVPPRDDLAYLDQVIAAVDTQARIDRDRIYLAGFSQGGIIGLSYACKRAGVLAGVAVVGMTLPAMLRDDCADAPAFPLLLIHGTDDPIVPFDGGRIISGWGTDMTLLSHDASIAFFADQAGCTGVGAVTTRDALDDGTAAERSDWAGCDVPLAGVRITGGGHKWPSGGPDLPFIGRATFEFDGATEIWEFFATLE
ncbi:alpha/beta hydrolase family esterase [Maritimibacter fusiformis]|nr:PHB depolymerase family esterase [Maritimibacter fusiformis]